MYLERTLPQNSEAEENVIGSVLLDPTAYATVADKLAPSDFTVSVARDCWMACIALFRAGSVIDQATVANELGKQGKLEGVGGSAYLSSLIGNVPTSLHVEAYADIVKRCSVRRQLVAAASEIAVIGYDDGIQGDPVQMALSVLMRLHHTEQTGNFRRLKEIADDHFNDFEAWLDAESPSIRGLSTGIATLDMAIDGLEKGKLYLVGGRPGMGKTQLALTIARNVARAGRTPAVFSLEMSGESLLERLVLERAGVDRFDLRMPKDRAQHETALRDAYADVGELPIRVDSTSGIKTETAMLRIMALQARQVPVDLLIFDYIDLAGDRADTEEIRQHNVAKALRHIARTTNVPVLAMVQLNRQVESRPDRRPKLSDLRYSGGLEQTADVVLLLFRHEYYWPLHSDDFDPRLVNVLDVIIAKNRDGAPGQTIQLYYKASVGSIRSFENKIRLEVKP